MQQKIIKHIVPANYNKHERITDYAKGIFAMLPTKSSVKKAIKKDLLLINNEKCTTANYIKSGQIIELISQNVLSHKIFRLKLEVIYEDDFIAIINKPAGFSVSGNKFKTIANALSFNLKKSEQEDALPKPIPVHRLDNQTSGLLIIAKTKQARIILGKQFEKKEIEKKYYAVVIGKTPLKGNISIPIEGKASFSIFELIKTEESLRNGFLSLIKLSPKTGRTHQLRIHCEASGFPILGDKLYNANKVVFKGKGLFLSSTELSFSHPITNKFLEFAIPIPNKFTSIMEREKLRFIKQNKI